MWKKCGRLDVSAGSLGPTPFNLAGSQALAYFSSIIHDSGPRNSSFSPLLKTSLELPGSQSIIKPCHWDDILAKDLTERVCLSQPKYHYLERFSEEDVDYFRRMPFSLSIPSHGVLVVHAGIVPGTPLEDQLLDDLINVSTLPPSVSRPCPMLQRRVRYLRGHVSWRQILSSHEQHHLSPCQYSANSVVSSGFSHLSKEDSIGEGISNDHSHSHLRLSSPAGSLLDWMDWNHCCVQAGYKFYMVVQMRHVAAEGTGNRYKALPKFPRSAGQPWANIYNGPQHVIFGHHARRRLQVRAHALIIVGNCANQVYGCM